MCRSNPCLTRMLRTIATLLSLVTLPALAQGAKSGDTFRDWTLQCESARKGTAETCYIFQNLRLKKDEKQLLHMAVGYLAKSGKPAAFLTSVSTERSTSGCRPTLLALPGAA